MKRDVTDEFIINCSAIECSLIPSHFSSIVDVRPTPMSNRAVILRFEGVAYQT
jgi:hypothetical protein